MTAIVTKQAQMIETLHNKLVDLQRITMKNNIIMHNVPEEDDERPVDIVGQLLLNKTGVRVDIERAHRMGAKREKGHRPLIARINRQDEVDTILLRTKPAKGANFDKKAIRVTPQIPTEIRHARAKMHFLAQHYRESDATAKIKVHEDKIVVNGVTKRDQITPPSAGQILEIEAPEMIQLRDYRFIHSDETVAKGSKFKIYCHPVRTLADVRMAYKAISSIPQAAKCTHLISAYKIDEKIKGYQDDGDYGFGQQIMRTITDKGQQGMVYFLTRHFGGRHLGRRRFQIVHDLLIQTIERTTTLSAPTASPPKSTPPIPNAQGDDEDDRQSFMDQGDDWRMERQHSDNDNDSVNNLPNSMPALESLPQRVTMPRPRPRNLADALTPVCNPPSSQAATPGANGTADNDGHDNFVTGAVSPANTSIVQSADGLYN
jgi:hypothetical protein